MKREGAAAARHATPWRRRRGAALAVFTLGAALSIAGAWMIRPAVQAEAAMPVSPPAEPPAELSAARRETEQAAGAVRDSRDALERFERDNAALLSAPASLAEDAMAAAEAERRVLERQIATLEGRRAELDRSIGDLERAAEDQRQSAATELAEAMVELERLERLQPIDHPDVVRQAHRVSMLHARAEATRPAAADAARIDSLSRERRQLDGEVARRQAEAAAARERIAALRAEAAQAPIVAQQRGALTQLLAEAQRRFERAAERERTLDAQHAAALAARAVVIVEPRAERERPVARTTIAALGIAAAALAALGVIALLERLDRRVDAAAVRRLQGEPPLATIPFLGTVAPKVEILTVAERAA